MVLSWFKLTVTAHWNNFLSFLSTEFFVAFLFLIQWGKCFYSPTQLRFILRYLQYNKWTLSKTNSLPFIDSSNLFWCILMSDLKNLSVTLSTSSFSMISMLPLFEWITRSSSLSSLEEIKFIVIFNLFLHVSDIIIIKNNKTKVVGGTYLSLSKKKKKEKASYIIPTMNCYLKNG